MKRFLSALFLIFLSKTFSQTNFSGGTVYKLNISAYMGRGDKACGNMDGLKEIRIYYANGDSKVIWSGRKIYEDVDHEVEYTEANRIVKVQLMKTIRYEKWSGCDGGPYDKFNVINNITPCFSYYDDDAGDGLRFLTVTSRPYIKLDNFQPPIYLGSEQSLTIALPDNLNNSFYNWKYRVGSGAPKNIPAAFNNKPILNLRGKDFLTSSDFGKDIDLWVEMGCVAGEKLAKGIARRTAYHDYMTCKDNCTGNYLEIVNCAYQCMKNYQEDPEGTVTSELLNQYQSKNSNSVKFTYLKSAPTIVNKQEIGPQCFDDVDGSVKIYFNRQVASGEKISYVLYDKSKPAGDINGTPYYTPVLNENDLKIFLTDGTNYYLELSNLSPSENYFFQVIGFGSETSNIEDVPNSEYNGAPLYTEGQDYYRDVSIIRPDPVEFTIMKEDISCKGAADGAIKLSATGGLTDQYQYIMYNDKRTIIDEWTNFSNGTTHTIAIDKKGTYKIYVMDANGCEAITYDTDSATGNIQNIATQVEEVVIKEPEILVASKNGEPKHPKGHGFTDGAIYLKVTGGTLIGGNNYNISWMDDQGNSFTGSNSKMENNSFYQDLLNIGAGIYTATITDAQGCTTDIEIPLTQPDKLELVIAETNPISCNTANSDDEFKLEDGQLTASASGGVAPYIYTWKRKRANGTWETLKTTPKIDTPSTLDNLGKGEYAVNVRDDNDIILGTYNGNNELVQAMDSLYALQEPDPIKVAHTKEDVFCKGGNNAWIQVAVIGGTGDYTLQWSNGETSTKIENLYAGTYTLRVTDVNGCQTVKTIEIDEPENPLELTYTDYRQPLAAGHTDGYIEATITGGTPTASGTFDYIWVDGQGNDLGAKVTSTVGMAGYVITLGNIGKGDYYLTITDANYAGTTINAGCTIESDKFEMHEPDPLELTLVETQWISCNAQSEQGNPFADGELTAHASGGVWLQPQQNNGLPYYYNWKKRNADGDWAVLTEQTDSIARNLDAGEYAVNIMDANGIILGIYNGNNELVQPMDTLYTLKEPPLLQLTTKQQNVYCHQGSDGWAMVEIVGGSPPYSTSWSNGDTTLQTDNLSAGTYTVSVTDSRGCESTAEVDITEPTAPVAITYPAYGRPTSIGASDAFIEAQVTGGTTYDDGSYTYVWTDGAGNDLNARTRATITEKGFTIFLENVKAGTYYLTVQDKNYGPATTKTGCTIVESGFSIYEPIEATIEVYVPISCNQANAYQDPYGDGALIAHVEGGVPFASGEAYTYFWKKQNANGAWEHLTDQEGPVAYDLGDGLYALNVEDSRGTVMGIYQGDLLIQAVDSTFYLKEPDLLQVAFRTSEISCGSGNNGSVEALISGGVPPYSIQWSNGATTPKIENLIAGTYVVFVTDGRGCEVSAPVSVAQPGGLQVAVSKVPPTCYQGSDGRISVNVTGGVAPYEYLWSTGNTTGRLEGLPSGPYILQVTDAQGCTTFVDVTLEEPGAVTIDLGGDRTLCNGQEVTLDMGIDDPGAQYLWESDNGFISTEAMVTLTEPGIYTATLTTSKGCMGKDELEIKASSSDIDAHFLLASQAFVGEEAILVNVSDPVSEVVEWSVPEGVEVVSKSHEALILKFARTGKYEVSLRSFEGACYQDYTKSIIVEEAIDLVGIADKDGLLIKEFIVYPNPSDGNFKAKVTLSEESGASLRLISMLSAEVASEKRLLNNSQYEEAYQVVVPPGIYILLLETLKGNIIRKVLIN